MIKSYTFCNSEMQLFRLLLSRAKTFAAHNATDYSRVLSKANFVINQDIEKCEELVPNNFSFNF